MRKVEKSEKDMRVLKMYLLFIHILWINRIINVENSGNWEKLDITREKIGEKREGRLFLQWPSCYSVSFSFLRHFCVNTFACSMSSVSGWVSASSKLRI